MLTAKHPLRRLLAGAASVASACVLYAGATAYPAAGTLLEVAAGCGAVLAFGFLVAALMGYVNNALVRFVARYPARSRRLQLATVVALLFLPRSRQTLGRKSSFHERAAMRHRTPRLALLVAVMLATGTGCASVHREEAVREQRATDTLRQVGAREAATAAQGRADRADKAATCHEFLECVLDALFSIRKTN